MNGGGLQVPRQKISLLLSGGGFRATMFHLGTVRYLRETNRLADVNRVFSVSGGSILAAHLAINWSDYCGNEKQFDRAASELVGFAQSGLRETIIRKTVLCLILASLGLSLMLTTVWLWIGLDRLMSWLILAAFIVPALFVIRTLDQWFRPVAFLEQGYRRLYKSSSLQDLRDVPVTFHFLATNLTTGNIACFTDTGIYPNIIDSVSQENGIASASFQISQCVAASSAFPPLFSPVLIDPRKLKVDQGKMSEVQCLVDGGVFDNLGLRASRIFAGGDGLTVVSDAERRFDWSTDSAFRYLVGRASRATDILMNRVTRLEFEILNSPQGESKTRSVHERAFKFIRLQEDLETEGGGAKLTPDLQRRSRRIRTDLDAFRPSEIQLLFCSGYIAAKHAFEGRADLGDGVYVADNGMPSGYGQGRWLPFKDESSLTDPSLLEAFDESETPKSKLWDPRSIICWAGLLASAMMMMVNPISIGLYREWPAKPHDIVGERLVSFSNIAESYSMLMAFSPRPQELASFENYKTNLFLLESLHLDQYTGSRRPDDFEFTLIPPNNCRIAYHNAFLSYDESDSLVSLSPIGDESEIRYEVFPKSRHVKVLMIIAVAIPQNESVELSASDFELKVR